MKGLIEQIIEEMSLEDIDITLSLLHKRVCKGIAKENCRDCPWRWSILCKYVYEYLKMREDSD